jgi:hypothetical protein
VSYSHHPEYKKPSSVYILEELRKLKAKFHVEKAKTL